MNRIVKFVETNYRHVKAWLYRQTQTGEYWQPRCYRGDEHWHSPLK